MRSQPPAGAVGSVDDGAARLIAERGAEQALARTNAPPVRMKEKRPFLEPPEVLRSRR